MLARVAPLAGAIAIIGANAFALSPMAGAVAGSFRGVGAAEVVQVAVVYGLATAASALLLAPISDRAGHTRALAWSLIGLTAGLALSAAAPSLIWLCIGQAVSGLAAGCALPAIYALAVRIAQPGRERETLGLVLTGWTASLVVGVSLAAAIADYAHWRVVFLSLAVAAAGLAFAIPRIAEPTQAGPWAVHGSVIAALRVPGVGPALLIAAAYMSAFYGFYAYLGVHLTQTLGLSTVLAGLAPAAYGIGFGLAAFADRWLDRIAVRTAAAVSFLGLALTYAALGAVADQAVPLAVLCLLLGVVNHIGLNLIIGRLTALDLARQGAIMGLYSAVTYLAGSAGALAYRPLFERFGLTGCALVSAICILPALAVSQSPDRPKTALHS